jgi:hypothetical protein
MAGRVRPERWWRVPREVERLGGDPLPPEKMTDPPSVASRFKPVLDAAPDAMVVIEHLGEELRVRVTDSGPGIASEDQARVFEPFERGARASQELVPGLGLGLAVVSDLAAAIGARGSLSSAPGAGSTFTVALPRRRARVGCSRGGEARGAAGGTAAWRRRRSRAARRWPPAWYAVRRARPTARR